MRLSRARTATRSAFSATPDVYVWGNNTRELAPLGTSRFGAGVAGSFAKWATDASVRRATYTLARYAIPILVGRAEASTTQTQLRQFAYV